MTQSEQLTSALAPFVETGAIPGAVVLIAGKNGVLAEAAVGYADIERKRPMEMDCFFWVASQTKPVTASAVMMLVDEGLISLDDPIEKHLPQFEKLWVNEEEDAEHRLLKRPERSPTVRELLCHMSGMLFGSPMEDPGIDRLKLEDAVRSYVMTPLKTHPGREFLYSNMGFNTAGRMIEVLSGMSYESFIEERLLRPLKMDDTTFHPSSEQLGRLAKTYRPSDDQTSYVEIKYPFLSHPLDSPARHPVPGGGLFSTASDMANFLQMILDRGKFEGKQLLSEASIAQMSIKQTPAHIENGYGLGWAIGEEFFSHGGACGTDMRIYPDREIRVIFMIQHQGLIEKGQNWMAAVEEVVKAL